MSGTEASMAAQRRILVACVGNIFLGDDGFGVAVAERLRGQRFPAGVEVVDFGIRGVELAYTLLDGYDALVLVDVVPRGGAPGTLYLIEPESGDTAPDRGLAAGRAALDSHNMDPAKVLAFAYALGAPATRTLIVGCEPTPPRDGEDLQMPMGLSAPVRAAVAEAVAMIEALVRDLCAANAETPVRIQPSEV